MKLTTFYGKRNRDKATCGKNAVNFLAAYILYIKYISTDVLLCAYCRYAVSWLDKGQGFVASGASFNNNYNNNNNNNKARILGATKDIKRKNQNRKVVLKMAVPTLH